MSDSPALTAEAQRYSAFISYSHADQKCATWLHRKLEHYRLPRTLVGTASPHGTVPRHLLPVFRDRDELPASSDLGVELRAALARSQFQIVICSPSSAMSHWVNEEILSFKRLHGEARTLALIIDGEPYSGDARECFPAALRFRLAADGTLSNIAAEPIAADIRPSKDGRRLALLKLVSGLAGLKLDALVRRDVARKQRRLAAITAISVLIAVITIGLAIYAETQRQVAEAQRRLADKSLTFLIETFAIANPATENPRTITVINMLERTSRRASAELRDEPAVSARLLQATGEIYYNLGLPRESERDLRASLRLTTAPGEQRTRILLKLAGLAAKRGAPKLSDAYVSAAEKSYDRSGPDANKLDAAIAQSRGMIAYLGGDYARSAKLFGDAVAGHRAAAGDNREEIGRALMSEAQALLQLKAFGRADPLFSEAAALYLARFGADNVLTAAAVQNQALNDFESGRYTRAEKRIERALSVYSKVLEADHPTVAAANLLLGRIRIGGKDYAGALRAFDNARKVYSKLYGRDNPTVGDVDFYAAEAASAGGDSGTALAMLGRTKVIYDTAYGPDDPDQVELLLARARVLARSGRVAQAEHDCLSARALHARIAPSKGSSGLDSQTCIAMLQPFLYETLPTKKS